MAKYVRGSAVANATSYELFEKVGEAYNSLATDDEINFEVSALGLAGGGHSLAVQAHADGYDSSDYSNEVTYYVSADDFLTWTINSIAISTGQLNTSTTRLTSNLFSRKDVNTVKANGDFEFLIYAYASEQASSIVGRLNTDGEFTDANTGTGHWQSDIDMSKYPSDYYYRLVCRYASNNTQTFTEVVTDCAIVNA